MTLSGAGKTRTIVIPNLLQAEGSYIVSDPKGTLYRQYGGYLKAQGYVVKKLDFTEPTESVHYNCLRYIHCEQDIIKVAHMLICQRKKDVSIDPFWDQAAELLLQAVIGYLYETTPMESRNLASVYMLLGLCSVNDDGASSALDVMFEKLEKRDSDSFAVRSYNKFRIAASRTLRSILITLNARVGLYDSKAIRQMSAYDDIDIASIGDRKTALFVVVSDTDRSMDGLANLFFTQAINELCRHADKDCKEFRLSVETRFILDDFATNCKIEEFPRMISSIRSRGISAMLMIQAESQLKECFGYDGKTIIGNCDTYVYLGGNDIETAKAVAERCDVPVRKILNMPVGTSWIFRRGEEPVNGKTFELDTLLKAKHLGKYKDEIEL